jgi:hypothetical protein
MYRRQGIALGISLLLFLAAIALPLVEFDLLRPGGENIWLGILIAFCCLPALTALMHGDFDIFEPIYPISFSTLVYFGVMVIVSMSARSFRMLGIDYQEQVPKVIFLALVALMSFYVAYYAGRDKAACAATPRRLEPGDRAYAHRLSWLAFGLFATLFVSWIVVGRVPLWSMWIFGGGHYGSWNQAATGVKLGYLYGAQEALPTCVLLLIATRAKRQWPLLYMLLALVVTILFVGLGVRARVLLMLGSLVAYSFLEAQRRPALWQILAIAFVAFYGIVGAIGYFRGPESATSDHGLLTLADAWRHFVAGSDIATTTAMYVRWTPVFGFDWGRQFLNLLLTPIPASIWPDKYSFLGVSPVEQFRALGAAAPVFMIFYTSFGSSGVVLGMAIFGWICRRAYNKYQQNPLDPFAQISVALLWAYLFHIYGRHSITLLLFGALYVFFPVWAVSWLVNKWRRQATGWDRCNPVQEGLE